MANIFRYYTYTDPTTKKPQIIEWGGTEEETGKQYEEFRQRNPAFIGGEMKVSPTQLDISGGISPQPFPTPETREARTSAISPIQQFIQHQTAALPQQREDVETVRKREREEAERLLSARIGGIELKTQQQIAEQQKLEEQRLAEARGVNIR